MLEYNIRNADNMYLHEGDVKNLSLFNPTVCVSVWIMC